MRSELFTASPFKNRLEEKKQGIGGKKLKMGLIQRKKKKPEKKKTCRDSRRKRKSAMAEQPGGSKKMKVDSKRPTKPEEARNDMGALFCLACDEAFVDPPTEDWIQKCWPTGLHTPGRTARPYHSLPPLALSAFCCLPSSF